MVKTITDVVVELNRLYREVLDNQKGIEEKERSKIFLYILKRLFEKHHENLGYSNLLDFKSDVIRAKNNLKNSKSKTPFNNQFKPSEEINFSQIYEDEEINEGSGEVFTLEQIEELHLNPDSY